MTSTGLGSAACARWTRWYTRRLPAEVAAERRAEIASDLWEHGRDADAAGQGGLPHDLEVIGRVLSGIPADLSWRRDILRSHVRPERGGPTVFHRIQNSAEVALFVLAALGVAVGTAILPLVGTAITASFDVGTALWVLSAAALSGALVAGLITRAARPVLSTGFLVVGSLAPSVAMFWLPPMYLLTLAIAVTALATTRRRGDVVSMPT